jgi:hypothetical protein
MEPVKEAKLRSPRRPRSEFEKMLREASRNDWAPDCKDRPDEFVMYDIPPTKDRAKALCAECPLLQMCGADARITKPGWGIWGGNVWVDGRLASSPVPASAMV